MAELGANPLQSSVQILLPEAIDRRLARWAKNAPGASWPTSGGHITLLPAFVQRGSIDQLRAVAEAVCTQEKPFVVRLADPIAIQDKTRQDYFALFLAVDSSQSMDETKASTDIQPLFTLHDKLLSGLKPLREDLHPQLVAQPYLPHITLALGLGELEARSLVRELRMQPITANFWVETVWLVVQSDGEGARIERHPLPLGGKLAIEQLRQ